MEVAPAYGIQKIIRIGLCGAQVGCSPAGSGESCRSSQLSEKSRADTLGIVIRALITVINNIHQLRP